MLKGIGAPTDCCGPYEVSSADREPPSANFALAFEANGDQCGAVSIRSGCSYRNHIRAWSANVRPAARPVCSACWDLVLDALEDYGRVPSHVVRVWQVLQFFKPLAGLLTVFKFQQNHTTTV